MSGWRVIRTTNDVTHCEHCGRQDLRGTVQLALEDGSEIYAGTSCAGRLVGVSTGVMRGAIKAYDTRLEIARCNFPDWFRTRYGMTVEQFIRNNPNRRKVAEMRYSNYMFTQGFSV